MKPGMSFRLVCVSIAVLLLCMPAGRLRADDAWVPGIQELYRLDRMAVLRDSVKVASVSSYDRTGGNDDGFSGQYSFVRKEKGALVIADLKGPGVIYRIWTPTPTDDTMEFYFDGQTTPAVKVGFRELFLGKHPVFVRPLVGSGAGGFYSYVPLSYERSCKILIRGERVQFYQINYATYPKETPIKTFSPQPDGAYLRHLERARALFNSCGSDISAYVTPAGGKVQRFHSKVTLKSNESVPVFRIDTPGRIVGIRMRPSGAFTEKERAIVLRAYWDKDKAPAILSPVGDLFGYAWGEPAMKSLLVGTADGVNYLYYPMPFDECARIELFCEQDLGDRQVNVEVEVLFVPIGRRENEGKFYAIWRRENPTTKGRPFTFIETKGRGHLAGFIQQSQGFVSGVTPFFEGDDQTTIDGELVIHGTGSEDFYNGGWYDIAGRWESRRSFPLSGCLGYDKHLGRTGGYRLLLGDVYAYRESILQTIEHAPTQNDILNDYCGLTFLYSKERPTCDFALPDAAARKVVDLDRIIFAAWWNIPIRAFSYQNVTLAKNKEKVGDKNIGILSLRPKTERDQFGHHFISFICDIPAAGKYKVRLDAVRGPAQGKVQLFMNEAPAGPVVDMYAAQREVLLNEYIGTLDLAEGENDLMFKIVGRNEKSHGSALDITNIICER